jgi:hypothetical protein
MSLPGCFRRRKFDGVTDEIGDDLTKAKRVADKLVGNIRLNVVGKIEIILRRMNDEGLKDAKDGLSMVMRPASTGKVKLELPSRFQKGGSTFRNVQNVVYDQK